MNISMLGQPIQALPQRFAGQYRLTSPMQGHADRLEIRFGARKESAEKAAALVEARANTIKELNLKCRPDDLEGLRQGFTDAYYRDYVADSLVDIGEECYRREPGGSSLYGAVGDMNLSESDFACHKGLMGFATDFTKPDGDLLADWEVLGYPNKKAYQADQPRLLKPTAAKLGLTQAKVTDRMIFDKLESMSVPEIQKAFGFTGAKAVDTRDGFAGKTFVITGKLQLLTRSEAEQQIRGKGGKTASSVTRNTAFLVAGEKPGSKQQQAEKLGVPILDEKTLLRMLLDAPSP